MKITQYQLLLHRAEEMDDKVNALIQKDWQPLGAPFVLPPKQDPGDADMVYQAMVKYAEG